MTDAEGMLGYLIALRQAWTDEGGNLDWDDFYSAVEDVINEESNDRAIRMTALEFLWQSLLEYACHDFGTIMLILRTRESPHLYMYRTYGYRRAVSLMIDEDDYREFLFHYFAGIHRFIRALWLPDASLARAQVMYGWYPDIDLLWDQRTIIEFALLALWLTDEHDYIVDYSMEIDMDRRDMFTDSCLEAPDDRETSRGLLRIVLVCAMLELATVRTTEIESLRECILLFFRATPEHYVTVQEVQEFLRSILREESYDAVAGDLIQRISMLFPIDTAVRSLSDLARCSVRRAVMRSGPNVFPDAVRTLRIPRCLQNFIIGV